MEAMTPALLLVTLAASAGAPAPRDADWSPARRVLEDAIRDGAFPGCAAAAGTSIGPLWLEGLGRLDAEEGAAVTTRTLYDIASLTKVVGTTSVVLALARDGKLTLGARVRDLVPEFSGGGRDDVTIEHLLVHASGLPSWKPIFREAGGYRDVLARLLATPLEGPPGARERYSDLGFILLGEAAARAGGRSLPELERALVLDPLGLEDTIRNPSARLLPRIAPTEMRPAIRGDPAAGASPIRGTVHDENAAAGEGVTGHAGLFSTAEDLSRLAGEILRGARGESRIFPRALVERFTARRGIVPGSTRALGWDTPSAGSSAGSRLGPRAFGHTGFTGTSIWIDPDRDLYIILLSNRVYPTRENARIGPVRRAFADAVVACFEGKRKRV
jgi:CubicO group peptidase (beta-lactamase class C family)